MNGVERLAPALHGQFVRPHATRLVNPEPPAQTLPISLPKGKIQSVSSPLTTPMTRGSLPHQPNRGPPELPGVASARVSSSLPPAESPSTSKMDTLPCREGR